MKYTLSILHLVLHETHGGKANLWQAVHCLRRCAFSSCLFCLLLRSWTCEWAQRNDSFEGERELAIHSTFERKRESNKGRDAQEGGKLFLSHVDQVKFAWSSLEEKAKQLIHRALSFDSLIFFLHHEHSGILCEYRVQLLPSLSKEARYR